jgi:hypothetical protein
VFLRKNSAAHSSFLGVKGEVSHQLKATGKITSICTLVLSTYGLTNGALSSPDYRIKVDQQGDK